MLTTFGRVLWAITLAPVVFHGVGRSEEMARIEGVHYINGKPGPGDLTLDYQRAPALEREGVQVRADSEGHFVFDSVHPGEVTVGRFVELKKTRGTAVFPSWTASHTSTVFTEPGKTAYVEIGKPGSTVTGRLVAPENAKIEVDWQSGGDRRLSSIPRVPAMPENLSRREQVARWKEYENSEEGKAERLQHHLYMLDISDDGRFQVADVAPGSYSLWITVDDAHKPVGGLGVGQVSKMVEVVAGEDIDLGDVMVKLYAQPTEGESAPEFTVETLEGTTLKLSDLHGKFVLLDFWATWCGPCVAEIPHLKSLYERFGAREDFAMLGLSLDFKREDLVDYVAKEGLKWTQGYLGEWSKTDLPDTYGVRGIPAVFLIGPDGKILANSLHGEGLIAEVAKALGE